MHYLPNHEVYPSWSDLWLNKEACWKLKSKSVKETYLIVAEGSFHPQRRLCSHTVCLFLKACMYVSLYFNISLRTNLSDTFMGKTLAFHPILNTKSEIKVWRDGEHPCQSQEYKVVKKKFRWTLFHEPKMLPHCSVWELLKGLPCLQTQHNQILWVVRCYPGADALL